MYKKIKIFLEEYQQFDSNDLSVYDEQSYLSRMKELIQWRELSLKEKHQKRRFVFSVIKKTGNAEEFIIETTVIELYELAEKVLYVIGKLPKNDLNIRLTAMLNVFIFHVNEQRDTREMSTTSFKFIIDILNSCLENKTFINLNTDFSEMINLFNQLNRLITSTNL